MRVELVRHGQTVLQAEHRYVGRTDDSLSSAGAQALVAADRVPACVYVTTLQRTSLTAAVVFPGAELVVVSGLEEMDFGAFEQHNYAELERDGAYRTWLDGACEGRCPGGEKRDEFAQRVSSAFAQLLDQAIQQGEDDITVVTHGGTIMAVMERFGRPQRSFFQWRVAHGCGLVLDASAWEDERVLRLVGESDHCRKDVRP